MRASFAGLTPEQQAHFGNGLGPYWFPDALRGWITDRASWFFDDASWRHHDFGYFLGGDRWDRARCDWKFFLAMCRDALSQTHGWMNVLAVPSALVLSVVFFTFVRIGGQLGSFNYRDGPMSAERMRAVLECDDKEEPDV